MSNPSIADELPQVAPGAYVEPGVVLASGARIGANAVVLAGTEPGTPTTIRSGAVIGANATVLPGVTVGVRARVEPGAVVTRSVPPLAIVAGNPARIEGYVETSDARHAAIAQPQGEQPGSDRSKVRGVTFHRFRQVTDLRGNLSVGEFEREIPFLPRRYFLVFDVPTAETRGEHAHKQCEQFLVAVKGSISVVADDGSARAEFTLDRPDRGLYLPPLTWGIQYRYSQDAVLLVFASHYYDPDDYIRDYAEFLTLVTDAARA